MWGVPIDHEMFREVSNAQWLWYLQNFYKDQEEEFERGRDMVEYHASFIEPEEVRKIRDSRERAIEIPEDKFMAGIEFLFGKPLRSVAAARPKEQELHKINLSKVLDSYNNIQKEKAQASKFSYKDWTNLKIG
jgi:hypothetical protein